MRRYLPYLITAGLIALAITIVVTRPGPPGLSSDELAEIKVKAKSVPREGVQAAMEQWLTQNEPLLPRRLIWDRSLREATVRDLTVEIRLRLGPEESSADAATVIAYFDENAADVCQAPDSRLALEAGAVFVMEIERIDGSRLVTYRLSKDSCPS